MIKEMKQPIAPTQFYVHETTLGRLKSILKYGLLSSNVAKAAKVKGYRRNFKSPWNNDYVSLLKSSSICKVVAGYIGILVEPNIKITKPASHLQRRHAERPVPKEVLVKNKIPKEKFVGIVIGEVGYSYKLEKKVKPKPLKPQAVIKVVQDSGHIMPVYFQGEKIWP